MPDWWAAIQRSLGMEGKRPIGAPCSLAKTDAQTLPGVQNPGSHSPRTSGMREQLFREGLRLCQPVGWTGASSKGPSILCEQGPAWRARGRNGLSPFAQHSAVNIWVLHPVLGPCSTGKTLTDCSELVQQMPPGRSVAQHLLYQKSAELGLIQPQAVMASGAPLSSPQYLRSVIKEAELGFSKLLWWDSERQEAQAETKKIEPGCEECFFHC